MENEYIEEITSDVVENETDGTEDIVNDSDSLLSGEGADGFSDLENNSFGLETVQDENEGSENFIDEEVVKEVAFTGEEVQQILTLVLEKEREVFLKEFFAMEETLATEEALAVEAVPARTLFNTPLDEFSVSEGLLLCIFMLLFANFLNSIFKGSHWFGKL